MPARIGDTLPNGATIVDIHHDGVTGSFGAVLAVRSNSWHPYVVWTFTRGGETADTYQTYHGEYYDDLIQAIRGYEDREAARL